MLAGAADAAIIPAGIGGFIACKVCGGQIASSRKDFPQSKREDPNVPLSLVQALSKRNDEPHRASRPWDTGRDG